MIPVLVAAVVGVIIKLELIQRRQRKIIAYLRRLDAALDEKS